MSLGFVKGSQVYPFLSQGPSMTLPDQKPPPFSRQ